MAQTIAEYRRCIEDYMRKSFNNDELSMLCLDLGLTADELQGTAISERIKSLIDICISQGMLHKLDQRLKTDPEREPPICPDVPDDLQGLRITACIQEAIDCVLARNFRDALRLLDQVPPSQSATPLAVFVRAIATIQGEHPNALSRHQLESVMKDLEQALNSTDTRDAAEVVRILIWHDKYLPNGRMDFEHIQAKAEQVRPRIHHLPKTIMKLINTVNSSTQARRLVGLELPN